MSNDAYEKLYEKLDEIKDTLVSEIHKMQLQCVEHSEKIKLLWKEREEKKNEKNQSIKNNEALAWKVISALLTVLSGIIYTR